MKVANMQYESIVSIYIALFGGIITIFGISIAAIIALTQVLQPVITHAQARKILKSPLVLSTGAMMIVCLVLISIGIIGLNYTHNVVPGIDLSSDKILSSIWYLILLMILVITTVVLTITIFYQQTSLMNPKNALKNFVDSVSIKELREYYSYKGAVRPFPPMNKYIIKFTGEDEASSDNNNNNNNNNEEEYEELEKKYQVDLAEYEKHKQSSENAENPLAPIESYLFSNLKTAELSAFVATLKAFEVLISLAHDDKETSKYIYEVIRYYCKVLERLTESSVADGSISFLSEALESSHRVADYLIEKNHSSSINILQGYWKNTAYDAMGNQPIIFKQVMEIYRDIGETILREKPTKVRAENETANNIHRSLGWLGEQYLESHKPEPQALMNSEHQTEIGALLNTVLSFGWVYKENRPDSYPIIYFDSLYVIGKKLIKYYTPEGDDDSYANDISNSLFSLMYEYESFGEAACYAKNTEGAWISMRGLSDFIRIFESNKSASGLKKNALEAVLRIGATAYSHGLNKDPEFGMSSIPDYSFKLLSEHSQGVDLTAEGMEIFIKAHGNMDKVKEYLKKASPIVGTNFNLNLDD